MNTFGDFLREEDTNPKISMQSYTFFREYQPLMAVMYKKAGFLGGFSD